MTAKMLAKKQEHSVVSGLVWSGLVCLCGPAPRRQLDARGHEPAQVMTSTGDSRHVMSSSRRHITIPCPRAQLDVTGTGISGP